MQRLWETIGQALLDTNFRRYRVGTGLSLGREPSDEERALPEGESLTHLHDRINKIPGRLPLSRFEVGEVQRAFRNSRILKIAIKLSQLWQDYCGKRKPPLYPDRSVEFKTAIGLAATDSGWVEKLLGSPGSEATENVYLGVQGEDQQHLVDFLAFENGSGEKVDKCLHKFSTLSWTGTCWTSVTRDSSYRHPVDV